MGIGRLRSEYLYSQAVGAGNFLLANRGGASDARRKQCKRANAPTGGGASTRTWDNRITIPRKKNANRTRTGIEELWSDKSKSRNV